MKSTLRTKPWLYLAPIGLVLIGGGLSLIGEAIILKSAGDSFWTWFLLGTFGLAVFNSGLSVFGLAVVKQARAKNTPD